MNCFLLCPKDNSNSIAQDITMLYYDYNALTLIQR